MVLGRLLLGGVGKKRLGTVHGGIYSVAQGGRKTAFLVRKAVLAE